MQNKYVILSDLTGHCPFVHFYGEFCAPLLCQDAMPDGAQGVRFFCQNISKYKLLASAEEGT